MKNMKKLLSLLLALVMVMGLAVSASADETTYTLTVNGNAGHIYEVYQIFTGDLSGSVLSNIKWGSGVTSTGQDKLGDAATVANGLTDETVGTFEDTINDYLQTSVTMTPDSADADGKVVYTASGLAAGYYLVKDEDNTQEGENGTYTAYILKIVKDTSANAKDSVPEVDKAIDENGTKVNASDVNIGDTVTFTLTATLGDLSEYTKYKVVFHDTMSDGLTFKEYVSATLGTNDVKNGFTMTQDGQNLTFSCDDVIALGAKSNSVIVITYTATLNNKAEIGKPGNDNEVYLEYSNNPNDEGTGEPSTGNTPKDEVLVFTYELDVTKVDGDVTGKKLPDAEFVLYRDTDKKYVQVDANGKVTGWTSEKGQASTLKSDASGLFKVIGLDEGTYYLEETKAPAGYNLLDKPVAIVIDATLNTADDQAALTRLTISVNNGTAADGNMDNGIVSATVENNAGATLPETGGMGTTIFYTLGGILVVAAVVLLVTKRRMSAQ